MFSMSRKSLCERHGAWLVVDDAHGFGVLGQNGRGALEHFNLRSPNLVYVGNEPPSPDSETVTCCRAICET